MPANAAIYIQEDRVNLADVFDQVSSDKGFFKKASHYNVVLGEDSVRFNVMEPAAVPNHVNGLLGYIASLDQDEKRKNDTSHAISHTKVVLGLV